MMPLVVVVMSLLIVGVVGVVGVVLLVALPRSRSQAPLMRLTRERAQERLTPGIQDGDDVACSLARAEEDEHQARSEALH